MKYITFKVVHVFLVSVFLFLLSPSPPDMYYFLYLISEGSETLDHADLWRDVNPQMVCILQLETPL